MPRPSRGRCASRSQRVMHSDTHMTGNGHGMYRTEWNGESIDNRHRWCILHSYAALHLAPPPVRRGSAAESASIVAQSCHYLISEFISGGDLFSVLTSQQHPHTLIGVLPRDVTACVMSTEPVGGGGCVIEFIEHTCSVHIH